MNNLLDDLAVKYGSDKGSQYHHYTKHYDKLLSGRRMDITKVLEIGVLQGGSIKMWRDYFPNAIIYGVDINDQCKQFASDRIQIFIGNQVDDVFLDSITNNEEFDLIIDDGSHLVEHQIHSFTRLLSSVKSGGYYIIEDINTSYWSRFNGGLKKSGTSIEFLKDRIDDIYFSGYRYKNKNILNSDLILSAKQDLNMFEKNIESMSFYNGFALIAKR